MTGLLTRCLPFKSVPFSDPFHQQQALINALPTELYDEIAHFDYKDISPLVMSCKTFYLWGGRKSLTQNPEYLSIYVEQLLKNFSSRDIQRILSRFPPHLCQTSFSLSCRARKPFNLQSLKIVAATFPNIKQLFYTSAYTGYDTGSGFGEIAERIGIEIACIFYLPLLKGFDAFIQKIEPLMPLFATTAHETVNQTTFRAYKHCFKDRYIEKVAALFSNIEQLTVNFEPERHGRVRRTSDIFHTDELLKPFSLPKLPKLKIVNIEGANVGEVNTFEKDLFTKYKELESLRVNAAIQRPDWRLPPLLKTLSLGSQEIMHREDIEYFVQTCPSLESLTIEKLSSEMNTFSIAPLQAAHLHTLSISSDSIHFPDIFNAFPTLKSLALHLELAGPETVTLYPSNTLEKLSIKTAALHPELVPTIFLQYPNLKFLSLSYAAHWGPPEVVIPPTHPNLQLEMTQR